MSIQALFPEWRVESRTVGPRRKVFDVYTRDGLFVTAKTKKEALEKALAKHSWIKHAGCFQGGDCFIEAIDVEGWAFTIRYNTPTASIYMFAEPSLKAAISRVAREYATHTDVQTFIEAAKSACLLQDGAK